MAANSGPIHPGLEIRDQEAVLVSEPREECALGRDQGAVEWDPLASNLRSAKIEYSETLSVACRSPRSEGSLRQERHSSRRFN